MPAQYVKLVVLNSWGGNDSLVSAAMINLFEDKTNKVTAPGRVKITGINVKKKKATLKWKKVSRAKGYKIQYSTSKKFVSKKTKTKYTSKLNITIKKLKSKKTYYFRIKAYKNAGKNSKIYSKKWSVVQYKKIKQQSLVL